MSRSQHVRSLSLAMLLMACVTILSLFMSRPAAAQQAVTAEGLDGAKQLLTAMGADKQLDTILPLIMGNMRKVILQQRPNAQKEIDEALGALLGKFTSRKQEMIDLVARVYAERVPVEDMKAMAQFFASPAGKRFVALQPELIRESAAVGQKWGEKLGREVEAELRQELKKRGIDL